MTALATKTLAAAPSLTTAPADGLLQRKCACGNHTAAGDECSECKKAKSGAALHRYAGAGGEPDMAVSQPDDALEREAEAAAMAVTGVSAPALPRAAAPSAPALRRGETAQLVRNTLNRGGEALGATTREFMETRFQRDFSAVRVHRDEQAARSAAAVNALAYTSGRHVVFGAGQYAPETPAGRHLLAHELAHVVQQTAVPIGQFIARKGGDAETCITGHKLGQPTGKKGVPGDDATYYLIWGTWKEGDTVYSFFDRTAKDWIRWRFSGISSAQAQAVHTFLRATLQVFEGASGKPGCQSAFGMDYDTVVAVRKLSGEPQREQAAKKKAEEPKKEEAAAGAGPTADADKPASDGGGTPSADKDKKGGGEPSIGNFGPLSDAVKESKTQDLYATTRIKADATVLADAKRAALYLKVLEHFTGRAIDAADTTAAADGLDTGEIDKIVDGKPMRKALTALFSQGFREFERASGSDLEQFSLLEFLVCEQFTRGNPTATHNQLMIGKGAPETTILGIVERNTGILLYDNLATPLPGFGGVGFRDTGYIASRSKDQWGFNIANVEDAGLRSLLNALRQTFGDPVRMAIGGAEVYFNNIELVNAKVVNGLTEAVKQKFLDMLPFFVGFIAGHAVSAWLMRVPNPHVAAVGLALKGLLTAAGYIMEIDFAAGALERLMRAAAHLSHFERNEKNEVSQLSEAHLNEAAKIIQDMVAEIAALFATMALGKLVSAAHKGIERFKIECTHCDLTGPGAPEAKAQGKAETKGSAKEPAKAETKPEGTAKERSPQEIAKDKLAELQAEKSAKETQLREQRQQRDALRQEYNDAVQAKRDAVKEWDSAKDPAAVDAARTKAREAHARAEKANQKLEQLPGEEAASKELKNLDKQIDVEGIKANPDSRAALPCFAAESLVLTPQGSVPIAALASGDEVWAYDFSTDTLAPRAIRQLHRGHTDAWYHLELSDGHVRATGAHRFWVVSELAWRDAQSLQPGMCLRTLSGEASTLLAISREEATAAATFNLSVEGAHTYFVGPGVLVHNDAVDVGLGGGYIIYRGTNPKYPGKVYVGQTTELDVRGKPRGTAGRGGEHRADAVKALELDARGIEKLSPSDKAFYEFMKDVTLEPLVKGIATPEQASYLEQTNIEAERKVSGEKNVVNRRNQITSDAHRKEIVDKIKADPAVKAKGYCP